MSEDAFDDQCTGANPRYPLIEEIKEMYVNAYLGEDRVIKSEKADKKVEKKAEKKGCLKVFIFLAINCINGSSQSPQIPSKSSSLLYSVLP